ncbi:hypothetical protein CRG98_002471 [Punica granatum]|uniref:BAG domain-containing protein n=1 Tax=Punica granatum TaxID=22663 RepID=A0A2I0L8D8_PUNGR|nr:hypothetical protein CRG98_002471 [Punica granatum]
MDSPFFRSPRNAPSHPRYYYPGVRTVPVQKQPVHAPEEATRPPKVVSIPVHFVEPERERSGSALKIQKVFRGFLVRKSVRRIAALRREVEEVERRVSDPDEVELMRRDPRERLRMSEMLMNVLFRLDSVRGVDSGVRDCRKAVIKRAIALQEKVDEIVAVCPVAEPEPAAEADRAAEVEGRADNGGNTTEEAAQVDDSGTGEPAPSSPEAIREELDIPRRLKGAEAEVKNHGDADQRMDESAGEAERLDDCGCENTMIDERAGGEESEMCICDVDERVEENDRVNANVINAKTGAEESPVPTTSECSGGTRTDSQTDSSPNPQSLIEEAEENACPVASGAAEEDEEKRERDGKEEEENGGGDGERSRRSKELLERMMEDNGKMMRMMAELLERNERQTRLLSSLSQRVEQLEKAFVCEKLRRKKKRHASGSSVDCSETSPDPKKSGRK